MTAHYPVPGLSSLSMTGPTLTDALGGPGEDATMSERVVGPDRRRVLAVGAASALGITAFSLPVAAVAASASAVQAWSGTLTFSDVSESGFTVSWTGV